MATRVSDSGHAKWYGGQKDRVELDLDGHKAWSEIPALQNASSLGTCTITFDLPAAWTAANGATLSLGEVFDTFTVAANGRTIPIDQIGAEGDIGPYLKPGQNTNSPAPKPSN